MVGPRDLCHWVPGQCTGSKGLCHGLCSAVPSLSTVPTSNIDVIWATLKSNEKDSLRLRPAQVFNTFLACNRYVRYGTYGTHSNLEASTSQRLLINNLQKIISTLHNKSIVMRIRHSMQINRKIIDWKPSEIDMRRNVRRKRSWRHLQRTEGRRC